MTNDKKNVASEPAFLTRLFGLRGKTALVTGATGAFGGAAARALAGAGAHVVLAGRSEQTLDALSTEIEASGGSASYVALRPSSEEDCDAMVSRACEHGGLDILVSASGTNIAKPIEEMRPEEWDVVMSSNVRDSWLICRSAGKVMKRQQRGGRMILVSSARSQAGLANYSAYCPSKGAIDMLVKALACEYGPAKLTVNAIAPTVFRSDLTAWMYASEGLGETVRKNVLQRIPLGRLGEPDDFAGAIVMLASEASSFLTGHILRLDGGYTAT
jgi:NAD(P)-dependent dehydrogenase (short-subunit alcohol dehydrogenase family)